MHSLHQSAARANKAALKVYNKHSCYDAIDAAAVTNPAPEEPIIEASGPESVESRKQFEKEMRRQMETARPHLPRLRTDGGLRLGGIEPLEDMCVVWVQRWDVECEEGPIADEGATAASQRTAPSVVQPTARNGQSLRPSSTSDTSLSANVESAHDDGAPPGPFKAVNSDNMRAYAFKQAQPGTIPPIKPLPQQQQQAQTPLAQPSAQQRKEPELSENMHFWQPPMQRAWLPPHVPAQVFPPQQQDMAKATVEGKQGAVEGREGRKLKASEDTHFWQPSMQMLWSQPMGWEWLPSQGAVQGEKRNDVGARGG